LLQLTLVDGPIRQIRGDLLVTTLIEGPIQGDIFVTTFVEGPIRGDQLVTIRYIVKLDISL
jgi:hypothetical protein